MIAANRALLKEVLKIVVSTTSVTVCFIDLRSKVELN